MEEMEKEKEMCTGVLHKSPSNNSLREFFFAKIFFPFLFSRTERTRLVWWGLRVERHAHQPKQVARLVPCVTGLLQLGCQSCNDLHLSCCTSIANDKSASNNSLGEFFFGKIFFRFLFSQRENAFRLLRIARRSTCRSEEAGGKTCALLHVPAPTGMPPLQRSALVVLHVDRKRQVGLATTVSGNSFSVKYFFVFSILRERTRFVCYGLLVDRLNDQKKQVARTLPRDMVQLQPGYQSCNELRLSCCGSIANDKSASNNSLGEFFFGKLFFPFLFLAQRERVSFVADCSSIDTQIRRSR
jgi:hypothetical protein